MIALKKLHRRVSTVSFPLLLTFVLLFIIAVNFLSLGYIRTRNAYAFQVDPLPSDNLVVNPWFRSDSNPNKAGLDGWVNPGGYYTLSQKISNPTPDLLLSGRCSSTKPLTPTYCGTAAKLAADDAKGEVGVDSYLYQIVSANPENTKLKFFTHWVAHYVDPFEVKIYGSDSPDPNGTWTHIWTPLYQRVLTLYKGEAGNQSSLWTHFTSLTPPVETLIPQGYPYYKVEIRVVLPSPEGFKMTGVYFAAAPEFEVTPTPTDIPPTPDPNATFTPTPTAEPSPTLEPTPTPVQLGTSLHVSDLEGFYGRATGSQTWYGTVNIAVNDENQQPVSGVAVSGEWTAGSPTNMSCVTGADGKCNVASGPLEKSLTSVSFTVTNLESFDYDYHPLENTDADGDSNGTSFTITR